MFCVPVLYLSLGVSRVQGLGSLVRSSPMLVQLLGKFSWAFYQAIYRILLLNLGPVALA